MKGAITLKILEMIEEAATTAIDLVASFIGAGYGASSSKLNREFEKRHLKRESQIDKLRTFLEEREKLSKLIYKLKRDGLITIKEKRSKLFLTPKGKERLKILKKRLGESVLPRRTYQQLKDDKLKIVIFDIPEQERKKRDWLRTILRMLNFKMLQKSVWIGKNQIPEELIEDLNTIKIISYIEIFEISKSGTLKQIVRKAEA